MHVCEFIVDKITNSIEEIRTGRTIETDVLPVSYRELKGLYKKDGWKFDWKKECRLENRQVYKLVRREGNGEIEGVISFVAVTDELYCFMKLIEVAPHNYGSKKQFAGVAGNLVAFVCKMSFDNGFGGLVNFDAKTRLIQHYVETLGAQHEGGGRMVIYPEASLFLVNSYF